MVDKVWVGDLSNKPLPKKEQKREHYDPPVKLTCRQCRSRYWAYQDKCYDCGTPKPVEPKK